MSAPRPRRWLHRGTVEAAALFFDLDLIAEAEARHRVLGLWRRGMKLHRVESGLLLRFAEPIHLRAAGAPGLALVAGPSGCLLGVPLDKDALAALKPPARSWLRLRGGTVVVEALSAASEEDPASWLDLENYAEVEVESLGLVPEPPDLVFTTSPLDIRQRLGDKLPPASAESVRVLEALRDRARRAAGLGGGWSDHAQRQGSGGGWWQGFMAFLAEVPSWFRKPSRQATTTSPSQAPEARDSATLLNQIANQLRWFAFKLTQWTRLSRALGWRQTQYFVRLFEMLEDGDLDQALRHAIPLGNDSRDILPPALGLPQPRSSLEINPFAPSAGSSYSFATDALDRLRQLYRQAAERLERQGRIDEAAFVMVELLDDSQGAVLFLERHGRLRLAAEIAEARELPPGLVVRLWFLAGEPERAVLIARLHRAFGDAVFRLERHEPERAAELRRLWAESLAEGGHFLGAVRTLWPLAEVRLDALPWIETGLASGGSAGATLLAYKAVLAPEHYDDCLERARLLCADASWEGLADRRALGKALVDLDSTAETATLARLAARAALRDTALFPGQGRLYRRLARFSGDQALRTELRTVEVPPAPALDASSSFDIEPEDRGVSEIWDAVYLPGGRLLVALGELGVRLLNRQGRTVTHFEQPSHHLVVSDNGTRAIAIAERGESMRLARLDLVERRAEPWCEARLDSFARNFDGSGWFVASDDVLLLIDVTEKDWKALWRLPEIPLPIGAITCDATSCSFLVGDLYDEPSCWRLELPSLVLRRRDDVPTGREVAVVDSAVAPDGRAALLCAIKDRETTNALILGYQEEVLKSWPLEPLDVALGSGSVTFTDPYFIQQQTSLAGVKFQIFDPKQRTREMGFVFHGAERAGVRGGGGVITLWDDRGRIRVLDLNQRIILRDLRL